MIHHRFYIPSAFRCILIICALISTYSCGNKHVTKTNEPIEQPRPEWVSQRPMTQAYYVGIGSCSKATQPLDYQSIAKKNALNDLASEISVRVQGETFLHSLEVNKNFSEDFISTISTTTDEQIENYEIAGQWESKTEFWVFYRLNKAEYQRQKAEKKNAVLSSAYDYYEKSRIAERAGEIPDAVDLILRGLFALKPYWSEVNLFQTNSGESVYLDNELYASLRRIITGIRFSSVPDRVILSWENEYRSNSPVIITYDGNPVHGIPVRYSYPREKYMKPRQLLSDQEGRITPEISGISILNRGMTIDLVIDAESLLPSDLDRTIEAGLIKTIRPETKQIPVEIISPVFYVDSDERAFGTRTTLGMLAGALQSELVKKGMTSASKKEGADFSVFIASNTTEGGTSQGFTVAHLELSITGTNLKTGETFYRETKTGIKGLQLNKEAAGLEAYKKGKEKVETEVVKSILESIL